MCTHSCACASVRLRVSMCVRACVNARAQTLGAWQERPDGPAGSGTAGPASLLPPGLADPGSEPGAQDGSGSGIGDGGAAIAMPKATVGGTIRIAMGLRGASARAKGRLRGKAGGEGGQGGSDGGRAGEEEGAEDASSADDWTRSTLALVAQVRRGVGQGRRNLLCGSPFCGLSGHTHYRSPLLRRAARALLCASAFGIFSAQEGGGGCGDGVINAL